MSEYKRIDEKDISFFKSIIESKRLHIGTDIHEDYHKDEFDSHKFAPEIVIDVLTKEEIQQILQYCNEHLIPVTPRGSGTGLVGAAVATNGGVMINTSLMNRILDLDEDNLTLTVEPGVILLDIYAYVEERGFFYAPDPGEKTATIGGNISTNAGGMRAVKYGVTRDNIRGLEVVLMNGEVLNFGGKTVKNSSGYALKDLIVGSEGTLGIVTKALLKLYPKKEMLTSLLVPFPSLPMAIKTVPAIIKSKVTPVAIEYMERRVIKNAEDFLGKQFPDSSADAYLLLSFDGNTEQEIEDAYTKIAELCLEHGAIDVLISNTEERQKSIWSARGAFLEAIKASTTKMDECDVVVPRDKIAEFVLYTKEVEKQENVRIAGFGHAGDGNLHLYILKDEMTEEQFQEKLSIVFELLYKRANELGGYVSGEHGIGYAKVEYLEELLGETYISLLKGIKLVFDPKGLLNPGKVFK